MKNKNLKYIKNIDMEEVDFDSFCEGLLSSIVLTKSNCNTINNQIGHMTSVSFIPWFTSMKQYDLIIERMSIKNELLKVYKLFTDWFKGIENKRQKLYVAYFIKKDPVLCKEIVSNSHYYQRFILPMSKNFMCYVKTISDLNEEELIKNPFIYTSYVSTLRKNEMCKRRGLRTRRRAKQA